MKRQDKLNFSDKKIIEKFASDQAEFVDVGTDTKWEQDGNRFNLTARTSGNKREGLIHTLTVNAIQIDEISINETIQSSYCVDVDN